MYSAMIVDDEMTIREKLPKLIDFESYGFCVRALARNGAEALERMAELSLKELSPRLILLDIKMPVMDGLSFLKSLTPRQRQDAAVVILSGYSDFEYAKQAMCLGAKWYLTKPVDVAEAGECLRNIRAEIAKGEGAGLEAEAGPGQQPRRGEAAALLRYVEENFRQPVTIKQVAEHFHMNPAYLGRVFHKAAGMNFKQYLIYLRLKEAKRLLRTTDKFVYEIAEELGFSESSYFISRFMQEEGVSPLNYRNG